MCVRLGSCFLRQLHIAAVCHVRACDHVSLGSYISAVRSGNLLFLAGHIPQMPDGSLAKGKVGDSVTPEEANAIARQIGINIISTLKGV